MCNKSSLHIVKAMNFMLNYNELKRFYPDARRRSAQKNIC